MANTRINAVISSVAIAASLAACTTPGDRASIFGGKVDNSNIALASRAQAAMVAQQYDQAIELAERAVANSPRDAGFRALLGNAYFAAGRFASADAAYGDSLALVAAQPQVILKRSLVLIAQGRPTAAVALLDMAEGYIDEADRGLALALAGRADSAVAVLDRAARTPGADARTRQNLALAHAFAGDWNAARSIAAQDVPGAELDTRMQQWMQMAQPAHPSQKVAALTGVSPAAFDPGQPVRLALKADDGQRLAVVLPDEPAPVYEPGVKVTSAAPTQAPAASQTVKLAELPPVQTSPADVAPGPQANVRVSEIIVVDTELEEVAESDELAPVVMAQAAPAKVPAQEAPKPSLLTPADLAADAPVKKASAAPKPGLSREATRVTQSARSISADAERVKGEAKIVVQLGAYSQRDSLNLGWELATGRFSAISQYKPMAARTTQDGKKLYRLAAYGFTSDSDARGFCQQVQSAGQECFVRKVAGDSPFKLASR
ncbi:tetratricopeptide repeat protein [Sphingomicrobium flavum]|uniref:tetratricopeptide repeat protein n=1 Tax=Sphingomicrobium flavum TaxID=1229164 RepID=UPI0021ADC772|nr:tetratricopeptide repeat protein [Sphingomicrobium flavum]